MLLSWEIPNVAARIAESSVSLNLAHALEAGLAAYGLGRVFRSGDSSTSLLSATPLAQNLEAGEKAAANSQVATAKLPSLQPSSTGNRNSVAPAKPKSTVVGSRSAPATQVGTNGSTSTQRY